MIIDRDVQTVFEQCFQARRAVAVHAERVRSLEAQLEVARRELQDAESALSSGEERMQRLAERAAGVDSLVPDSEIPPPRLLSEFRPIRR